jgi:UDP-N-acetylmuramoyl-L-alanyl-D-glutamate--2,6-diaminopimelate ligase
LRTTPEAPDLQAMLAGMRDAGRTDVAIEASSHGLDLHRLDGTRFRSAVFTNLTRDHLDHHGDMESYFAAKASLFTADRARRAIVSIDDEYGRRLTDLTDCPCTTVSAQGQPEADWRASEIRAGATATTFRASGPGVDLTVRLHLLGAHQVDNALAALAALVADGVAADDAVAGFAALRGIPGRLQRLDAGQDFTVFVDYAHNSGAQARVLSYLRTLTPGRLIMVIGAAGERDLGKRQLLARTAAAAADLLVITDESPYGEDPRHIRADLLASAMAVPDRAEVLVVGDRGAALDRALAESRTGDTLFVGGRGHERWLRREGFPAVAFDDVDALTDRLEARMRPQPGPLLLPAS